MSILMLNLDPWSQAQDSPDSLFSFNIDDFLVGDEVSSESVSATPSSESTLADTMKSQLQNMLNFLTQDISDLDQDPQPIQDIFQNIRGQLSPELESAIIPAAYIKGHQLQVLQAKKWLADRSAQQDLINQRDSGRQEATNLKKQIDTLVNAPASIDQEISRLKAREQQLLKDLEDMWMAINQEEDKLNQLPEFINKMIRKSWPSWSVIQKPSMNLSSRYKDPLTMITAKSMKSTKSACVRLTWSSKR